MKQLAIVSGKGGTGKTTLAASLGVLFQNSVLTDCDVDASNLYLLFENSIKETYKYYGGKKAKINPKKCVGCGVCKQTCRFDAIYTKDGEYFVDEYACEGCNACVVSCPENAIKLYESLSGKYYYGEITAGSKALVYARLEPGEETSGGLIAEVRKLALKKVAEKKADYVIIDGAPGVGCPATSSIAGVNYVVVVTEPTLSGVHDLKRIINTIKHFRRPCGVVINKYDLNENVSSQIKSYCENENIDILGEIPFDEKVMKAVMEGKPVILYDDSKTAASIIKIFENVLKRLK